MSKKILLLAAFGLLAACDNSVTLHKPKLTVGQEYAGRYPYVTNGPNEVVIEGATVKTAGHIGKIEISGLPICEAANMVIAQAMGVALSCNASGTMSFHAGSDVSPAQVMRAFLVTTRRAGVNVQFADGVVILSGKGSSVAGGASRNDVQAQDGAAVESYGDGAFTAVTPDDFISDSVAASLVDYRDEPVVVRRLRVDPEMVSSIQEAADRIGGDVTVMRTGEGVYIVGNAETVRAITSFGSNASDVTLTFEVSGSSEATVASLTTAYPYLNFSLDEAKGVLFVRGDRSDLTDAMPSLKDYLSAPRQVRLKAAFVEYSSDNGVRASSSLAGSAGFIGGAATGNYISTGRDLIGTISLLEDTGRASILQQPELMIADGGTARLSSGDQVPVMTSISETEAGNQKQNIEYRDTGVILNADVNIRRDGTVQVNVEVEVTSFREGSVAGSPIFTTRSFNSSFVVTSGQSVVLAGLDSQSENVSTSGISGLSKSGLFGSRSKSKKRSEMLLIITPEILGVRGTALH